MSLDLASGIRSYSQRPIWPRSRLRGYVSGAPVSTTYIGSSGGKSSPLSDRTGPASHHLKALSGEMALLSGKGESMSMAKVRARTELPGLPARVGRSISRSCE